MATLTVQPSTAVAHALAAADALGAEHMFRELVFFLPTATLAEFMEQFNRYEPEHLDRWTADGPTAFDSATNYAGADLSAFFVAPVSITRDSQTLERSNWEVVTGNLESLSVHDETGPVSMGHWACGWYEIFLIHESDTQALKAADRWACALADYPVADDEHHSKLEWDAVAEYWERATLRERAEALSRCNCSIFAARRDEIPQDDTGALFAYLSEGL